MSPNTGPENPKADPLGLVDELQLVLEQPELVAF